MHLRKSSFAHTWLVIYNNSFKALVFAFDGIFFKQMWKLNFK